MIDDSDAEVGATLIKTVGASLLAIAVYQSTTFLTDPPLSRASSLPQGFVLPGTYCRCLVCSV
ncbi:hypothetical protein FHK92_28120 [Pseudomonas brassicacearum subsp. neoaurantiaca]|uniref:Uncharacterized protein n=1 Tax=Pseudomonas brassicacearum subsp. neoaurantiaca TaxID=494916 RepID=A0A7V8UHB0_9PSED|nr:hypothetical protein [Pseudomonas brassicacearum subsp. neoaurantiaca]